MTSLEIARKYLSKGFQPIPLPLRAKIPTLGGWQKLVLSENNLSDYFNGKPQNISVLVGEKSQGLADVDLDNPAAVRIADFFLPKTEAEFGRASKLRSHRLYYSDSEHYEKFNDPFLLASEDEAERRRACIGEIRAKSGLQTVFPGSVHESGEAIEWHREGEPARIEMTELRQAVGQLCAASLIAKFWRGGIRQDMTMALCGALLRNGFDFAQTKNFLLAVCAAANDEEAHIRVKALEATAGKIKSGANVYGFPKLVELTDKKLIETACKWLQIESFDKSPREIGAHSYETGYSPKSSTKNYTNNSQSHTDDVSLLEAHIDYPKLPVAALYGLAGDVVRAIEPHTEADNAALLVQILAGFGNLINRTVYFMAGADYHYTKINAVLVGATASGRKGSSWGEIKRILVRVDESFRNCIQNGLSSGEGLIHYVRDPQIKKTPVREKGRIIDYQEEMFDEGAKDKRAFIVESEFARVLKVSQREGNTLSSVIRDAWDTDYLKVMTKNPVTASDAHISIIGHITKDELRRTLAEADTTNGFANRFLWVCVRRSKYLPDGGNLQDSTLNEIVNSVNGVVQFAKTIGEMKRDDKANELWHEIYKPLSDGLAGLVGSVTSRATAQTLRLACLYALLDKSEVIRVEHLKAALALWNYCEASAKYIFGNSLGNKLADEIFDALLKRKDGMSKNDIREYFQRNRTAAEINSALELLLEVGRIESFKQKTAGRDREIFIVSANAVNAINAVSPDSESENTTYSVNSVNSVAQTENEREVLEI